MSIIKQKIIMRENLLMAEYCDITDKLLKRFRTYGIYLINGIKTFKLQNFGSDCSF